MNARKYNRGFSLIELLVAVLVIGVGVLGVAGLQVVSLQQNRSALLRAEALQIGSDMLDRMRANPATTYGPIDFDDVPSGSAEDCISDICSPSEMADFDIAQWKCGINSNDSDDVPYQTCVDFSITGALPEGVASIEKIGLIHEVIVQWVDDRAGNTSSITLRTRTDDN